MMSLALSHSTLIYQTIPNSATAAGLIADLDAVLNVGAGWPHTAITGGWEYLITSPIPQNLQAKLRIWDNGDTVPFTGLPRIIVQFRSTDNVRIGVEHSLVYNQGFAYQMWANICELAIGRKNFQGGFAGSAVIGGVPFAFGQLWLPPCSDVAPPDVVTELWFSSGNDRTAGGFGYSFRDCYMPTTWWDVCYNGALTSRTSSYGTRFSGDLQVIPVRPASVPVSVQFTDGIVWYNPNLDNDPNFPYQPLWVEGLLAWTGSDGVLRPRAMLYDMALASKAYDVEYQTTTTEIDPLTNQPFIASWANYGRMTANAGGGSTNEFTDGIIHTSLFLLTGMEVFTGGGGRHYVY